MPDKRVTELDPIDAVAAGDLLLLVDDPGGTPVNKKATVSQLGAALSTGPHHATHEPGGSDQITTLGDLTVDSLYTEGTVVAVAGLFNTPLDATYMNSGVLPFTRIQISAASRLLGRGSSSAGSAEEITLGTGLAMTGTTLSATAAGGGGDVYLNVANVFTQDQTISKATPALTLINTGAAANAQRWQLIAGTYFNLLALDDAGATQKQIIYFDRDGSATALGDITISKPIANLTLFHTGGGTAKARVGQVVADGLWLTTNAYYTGVGGWVSDDPTKVGSHLGWSGGGMSFGVFSASATPAYTAHFSVTDGNVAIPIGTLTVAGLVTGGNLLAKTVTNTGVSLHNDARPAGERRWNILHFDGDGSLYFQTHNDTGGFLGNVLFLTRAGSATVSGLLTAGTGVTMSSGNLTGPGSIVVNGSIQSGSPVYPGTTGTGAVQATWYITGHPSYGLYSNTGFYLESAVWCNYVEGRAHIRAATGLYAGAHAYITGNANISERCIPAKGVQQRNYVIGDTTSVGPHEHYYDFIAVNGITSSLSIQDGYAETDGFGWVLRVRDNGVARPLYWGGAYMSACGVALPTATVPSGGAFGPRVLYMGFRWSAHYGKWQMIALSQE